MSQLNMNGGHDEDVSKIVLRAIQKLHANGNYDTQEVARYLLRENELPDWWKESRLLVATTELVRDVSTQRVLTGVTRSLKLEKPHQYRLRDWCSYEEKKENLAAKIAAYTDDGHAIRIDAGAIIKEHPGKRKEILRLLPPHLRPADK